MSSRTKYSEILTWAHDVKTRITEVEAICRRRMDERGVAGVLTDADAQQLVEVVGSYSDGVGRRIGPVPIVFEGCVPFSSDYSDRH